MDFKFKQVLIVRTDLRMSLGKMAVQVAHGALSASEKAKVNWPDWWRTWMNEGQCKIALRVDSEDELLELESIAKAERLPNVLVMDRGLTEVLPGTITCLALGPAPSELINKITGRIPLL